MKNFTFGGAKFFLGVPRGAEWSDFKNLKNPYTIRWSQPTANISAVYLNEKVIEIWVFWVGFRPLKGWRGTRFRRFEKAIYTTVVRTDT